MQKCSRSDIDSGLAKLSMLRYWPSDQATRAEIGILLAKMVPHREALRWLVDELVNKVGEWPGPAELRGLLCTRFKPADGNERDCSLPGYRPSDYEQRHYDEHCALKAGSVPIADSSKKLLEKVMKQLPA